MKMMEFKPSRRKPKIDIQNGNQITGGRGAGSLAQPKQGLILPGNFIPLFEKSELIVKLTAICLSTHAVGTMESPGTGREAGEPGGQCFQGRPVPE